MKIIGTTAAGFMAELTENDLFAILGATYSGDANEKLKALGVHIDGYTGKPRLMGAEIPVSDRFRRVTTLEANHAKLGDTAGNLRALATMLDLMAKPPLVPEPTPES